jgi:hypothetical protein
MIFELEEGRDASDMSSSKGKVVVWKEASAITRVTWNKMRLLERGARQQRKTNHIYFHELISQPGLVSQPLSGVTQARWRLWCIAWID